MAQTLNVPRIVSLRRTSKALWVISRVQLASDENMPLNAAERVAQA